MRAVYLNIQTLYPFQTLQVFAIVLVLSGIVLIFFLTEAGVGMCFGFVVKTELLLSSLNSAYTASRPFLRLTQSNSGKDVNAEEVGRECSWNS